MKTGDQEFGELLRELRVKAGYSLRGFAKKVGMQPSNLSFIENGRTNPPRDSETLFRFAQALGLKKGDVQWAAFFDAAAEEPHRLPADIAADKNVRDYLPIMMRTISNARLSQKELKELIEKVKNYRHG